MTATKERDDVTITELYKGKVIVKFYQNSHQYWVSLDGGKTFKRKTGVTTLIGIKDKSTPLASWQQQITADFLLRKIKEGVKIDEDLALEACIQNDVLRDEAADIGHEIHAWCEHWIKNKMRVKGFEKLLPIPDFPEATSGVNGFLSWIDDNKVKFHSTERPVYSKNHDFIGTMDFEATINGQYCMGDFKSSNGLYNAVRMQTAAYARADEEERKGDKYDGRWAIRLSKYTHAEYLKREERKQELKKAICRIKRTEYTYYPPKPYEVFEAVYLDRDKGLISRDFEAFLLCKGLTEWNKLTDPFLNKELNGSL